MDSNTRTTYSVNSYIESSYGKGKILAVTRQWIIHDNSLENKTDEFALLIEEDYFKILSVDEE